MQIAHTEWTRTRRQLGRSSVLRAIIAIVLGSIAVAAGISAYIFGTMLQSGQATLLFEAIRTAATVGFLMLLGGFTQQTSRLVERLETDHLLTTVPARTVVLGVVLAVSGRDAIRIFVIALSVAVGFAIGARSPVSVLTIVVAVAGFVALTALIGVSLRFAIELFTTRSPRVRRYKTVFGVVGFVLLVFGWGVVSAGLVSVDPAIGWLGVVPTAWFVDLALLGASVVQSRLFRSVGALGLIVVGIPVLLVVTTALATRVWETEPVSAASLHRSRSLVGDGFAERLFASHVSRPVLTVARKRWLQERRVPLALMMSGYLIILLPGVILPAFAAGEIPGVSLVVLAFICAAATGLGFGMLPVGAEYSSLPMTLTTVTGEQFVRGTVLAGGTIGVSVTVPATVVLTLISPLGPLETMLLALAGAVLCVCGVTLAAAIGMSVSYRDLLPVPLPLTSATIYAEVGRGGFIRMGTMLALLALVCLPAFSGYLLAFLSPGVTMLNIPMAVIRVGSLILTTTLAVGVSIVAYRRAVRLCDQYTIP